MVKAGSFGINGMAKMKSWESTSWGWVMRSLRDEVEKREKGKASGSWWNFIKVGGVMADPLKSLACGRYAFSVETCE